MTLLGTLGDAAGDLLRSGAVRVAVKTNLGPELEVAAPGQARGPGLLEALGIRAAVIVRDSGGRVVFRYGDPPATNPLLVAVFVATVALLGFALVRGFIKR